MKTQGLVLKESLENASVLDQITITKTEVWHPKNAAPHQSKTWTATSFEIEEEKADNLAEKFSQVLKPKGWYISMSTNIWRWIIFPNKVFKYKKGDAKSREDAMKFGRGVDIPEAQLDWED